MSDEWKSKRKKKAVSGKPLQRGPRPGAFQPPPEANGLRLQRLDGNRYAFVAPRCALLRDLDLDEVAAMRGEQEPGMARDELLFLVEDCRGFLEAYNILAELALEEGDIPLARGYYGFAYESGLAAIPPAFKGRIPAGAGYNRHFYLAGRGLARCLIAAKEVKEGRGILQQLLRWDPDEPDVGALLAELDTQRPAK